MRIETIKNWAQKNMHGDPIIWIIVILLSLLSIIVVYSATGSLAYKSMGGNTEYFLGKHTMMVLMALTAIWIAHKVDYRYYSKISRFFLWLSVPLLIYTWKFGVNLNDASRWLTVPFINQSFQPSDLAKLALITNLASMLAKRQHNIADFKASLIPMLFWSGIICGLIAMTNISTSLLLFSTCLLLMFIGRVPVKYLVSFIGFGVLVGTIALLLGQRGQTAYSRIQDFTSGENLHPQVEQSFIAVSTGGVVGKGPGKSTQRNLLPHIYADFLFAIIVEEYGMVGGVLIIVLYLALLYRGMVTVARSDHAFAGLLSAGLSFALVVQAFIHMGVVVGLGPVTGLPLPLMSWGGTSLIFTGLTVGIILSVSRGDIGKLSKESGNVRK